MHIGEGTVKELLGAIDGDLFHDIDVLAAAINVVPDSFRILTW